MVDGNIAAVAFNNFYDKWRWPLPSKTVMAIVIGLLFPPFTLLFSLCALINLCLFPIEKCICCILLKLKKPKDEQKQ